MGALLKIPSAASNRQYGLEEAGNQQTFVRFVIVAVHRSSRSIGVITAVDTHRGLALAADNYCQSQCGRPNQLSSVGIKRCVAATRRKST